MTRAADRAAKAVNLARMFTQRPLMFPALRARPLVHRSPVAALEELGFEPAAIASLAAHAKRAGDELYPRLAESWGRTMGPGPLLDKLRNPDVLANDSNLVTYLAVRLGRPATVVETGTFGGLLSSFVLRALADNGTGRLISLDLPAYEPIPRAIDLSLPPGNQPGWLILPELLDRFELVLGDSRRTLPAVLDRAGPIGLFVCDSLQTFRHMTFEYRAAWRALVPGGLLFSNNAFVTSAFWRFTQSRRLPFLFVGGDFGVTRKPL
jgi:hypothetical protein